MNKKDILMAAQEHLDARKWTRFLMSLPFGTEEWEIPEYRDFISIRTTASIISSNTDSDRSFSINQSGKDNKRFLITVERKK